MAESFLAKENLMMHPNKIKIVVGISGRGKSLENLWQTAQKPSGKFEIVGVVASNDQCAGLVFAKSKNIPITSGYFSNSDYPQNLEAWLSERSTDWIFLAGFIRVFPILEQYEGKIINIHPSLLPKHGGKGMYGLNVHRSVLESGDKISGATVHIVTKDFDQGPILAQVKVPVTVKEPQSLAQQVFAAECDLYPKVANWLADEQLPKNQPIIYDFM